MAFNKKKSHSKSDLDNHADQLNKNNYKYFKSRQRPLKNNKQN